MEVSHKNIDWLSLDFRSSVDPPSADGQGQVPGHACDTSLNERKTFDLVKIFQQLYIMHFLNNIPLTTPQCNLPLFSVA